MRTYNLRTTSLITIIFSLVVDISPAQSYQAKTIEKKSDFQWPEGKKMGLSLTFDDARESQIDKGIPLLDKYGVKATFYVSLNRLEKRLESWKSAVTNGHEMGNHSLLHSCTVNYDFSILKPLEDYTFPRIEMELDSANEVLRKLLGVQAVSFAYPCGQTFIGRGLNTRSYVPLVSAMFESGRGWLGENSNNPSFCDMAQLTGMELDGKTFDQIKQIIDAAKKTGKWLILTGHEMGEGGRQTSLLSTIEELCKYAIEPANGIWIDNVHNIAAYVKEKRGEAPFSELPVYRNPFYLIDQRVEDLLSRMTLEEKLGQLNMSHSKRIGRIYVDTLDASRKLTEGKLIINIGPLGGFFGMARAIEEGPRYQAEFLNELQKIALEKTRLKIPLLFIEEGTHGIKASGATVFPEGLAIGSTWNLDLVRNIYSDVAKEARYRGIHELCTIVIEPNRDPRLGRNEEGYSEDPYLCSQIAETVVEGMQGKDVSADDKAISVLCHFPGQSQPVSGLERGAMEISERTLREVFLPPWVAGIKKAGALGVMATYPTIDGEPAHNSERLLTKILREELGFNGLVLGEGGGINTLITERIVSTMKEAGELCLKAGVDVGISFENGYLNTMWENVKEGKVSIETIDRSVRRILKVKYLLGLFDNPYVDVERAVKESNTKESRELALQAAREGIVLLKNEKNLLPLDKNIESIAVIGPNANSEKNQLGDYISNTITQDIVTVLEGIKEKVSPQTKVNYIKGCEIIGGEPNEIKKAAEVAKRADIAIVVVGEIGEITNGEGKDVANLDLTGYQEDLIKAVYATGTPTVVVLINGRPLSIRWTAENIPVILEAWMCGEEGGNAIADVLFGDYNPGGRLPITFPRHSGQLPVYYNMHSKAQWMKRSYVDMSSTPLFEFGFGLSYTKFEYSNLQITPEEIGIAGEVYISLDVKNTGKRNGNEVVQLYLNDVICSMSTPVIELRGFEKISLDVGEKKPVRFKLTPEDLSFFDVNMKPVVEPGIFKVMIGSSSKDIRLNGEFEVK